MESREEWLPFFRNLSPSPDANCKLLLALSLCICCWNLQLGSFLFYYPPRLPVEDLPELEEVVSGLNLQTLQRNYPVRLQTFIVTMASRVCPRLFWAQCMKEHTY